MEVHYLQHENCQYRFLGQYLSKMSDFFPDLHLPDGMTTSPHPDHSTGPKPIQLVQVVFTIEQMRVAPLIVHCFKADLEESSKLLQVTNPNQRSESHKTFCTFS